MSNEDASSETGDQSGDMQRMLTIGLAAAAVIVLFVTTVSIVLIFALRSDVAALEDQARKTAKATKAMQDELASIKDGIQAAAKKSLASGGAKPVNIDAADPANDCVIRTGEKGGVANCIDAGAKEKH